VNCKVVVVVLVAVSLLLLLSIGGSYWDGSINRLLSGGPSWSFLETLFIFWLGMSQAGVLLSVFLLIMKVKIHRRTSLLLELCSLCCLLVSFLYSFYYSNLITFNKDVYGIGIVGFMALLFFLTHLFAADSAEDSVLCKELAKIRRPLAWIILPTVFWVVSALSLDFARFENSVWQGAFFPIYVVSCVFYSGLAFLIALLSFENYYNRLMEKFLTLCSWFMAVLFLWMFFLKGDGSFVSFIFVCIVPQFMFIEIFRENLWGRLMVAVCILFGILLKCDYLVSFRDTRLFTNFCFADAGVMLAGFAVFIALFLSVRVLLSRFFENDEILMGEVDDNLDDDMSAEDDKKYYPPFSAPEFKVVRLPVLCGILVGVAYGYLTSDWTILAGPIAAYVSCVLVCLQPFIHLGFFKKRRGARK